jgi:hypothetical protein
MPGQGHHAKHKGKSRKVKWQHIPADSISNPDPTFFGETKPLSMSLSHSQSKTWKSSDAKERDQFSRVKNLIHHFVPDSPFPPQNLAEWMAHRAAMQDEGKEALLKNIAIKQALRSADSRIPFKSAFGPDCENPLHDNRSTVLSLPSIWSTTYTPTLDRPDAQWPERAEMQHEGEDRAGGDGGKTNFGRFLPLPRQPRNETVKWEHRALMESLSMIDVTGIKPDTVDEEKNVMGMRHVWTQNMAMNSNEEFWDQGEYYLGKELMNEL